MLSSFVSYFSLSESSSSKGPSAEELEASRQAQSCVQDCHLDSLMADTKFLRHDSLNELVKVHSLWLPCDSSNCTTVFPKQLIFLHILTKVK